MDDKAFRKEVEDFITGKSRLLVQGPGVPEGLLALANKARVEQEAFRNMAQLRQQLNEQLARLSAEMLRAEGRASVLMDLVADGLVASALLPEQTKAERSAPPLDGAPGALPETRADPV